jgi:hypothetical protein
MRRMPGWKLLGRMNPTRMWVQNTMLARRVPQLAATTAGHEL